MRWQLNRPLTDYRALVEAGDPDVTKSLARVLLSMIDEPGLYDVDDRAGRIEITKASDDSIERALAFMEGF